MGFVSRCWCPGFGVVALALQSMAKAGVGYERLWCVPWARVTRLALCVLLVRVPHGLRVPRLGFWWSVVARSYCIVQ